MAVDLIEDKDLEDKKPQQNQAPNPIGGVSPSASTSVGGAKAPSSSGRFTNIQNVIRANVGNKLGSNLSQRIQGQAQQAKQGVQQGQQKFQEASQAGRFDTEANRQRVQSLLTDPTKATDEDVQAFEQYRTLGAGGYRGPGEIQDVAALRGQAQRAEQLGQAVGSTGGRQELLRQFAGRGRYTGGQQRLDTLLLDPRQLTGARQETRGIASGLEQANLAAQQQAEQLKGQAQKFTEETQAQLGETQKQALSPVEERLKQEQEAEERRVKDFEDIQALLRGDLSKTKANDLSLGDIVQSSEAAGDRSFDYAGNVWGTFSAGGRGGREIALNRLVQQGAMTPEQAAAIREESRNIERDRRDYRFSEDQKKGFRAALANATPLGISGGFSDSALNNILGRRNIADVNYDPNLELLNALQLNRAQNLTASGVASAEERAKLNALQRLAGQVQTYKGDTYQAGKLGTADPNKILEYLRQARAY